MKELTVVKIGGNIVDKEDALDIFLKDFNKMKGPKILIHGGGVLASEISKKLGIVPNMINGRRVTDHETLKIVSMVYAGWINKSIVAGLQKIGCNAIGLSGADGDSVPATKRAPEPIDFGYVGDVNPANINSSFLESILARGICPVFCAITHDRNGSLLNTNADTMASSVAIAMSRDYNVKLIYCFEKDGVLYNQEDPESIVPLITRSNYEKLKEEGVVSGGMIPKLDNAFQAIESGVSEVTIKHARNLGNGKGTIIR